MFSFSFSFGFPSRFLLPCAPAPPAPTTIWQAVQQSAQGVVGAPLECRVIDYRNLVVEDRDSSMVMAPVADLSEKSTEVM